MMERLSLFLLAVLVVFAASSVRAQELNCNVTIDTRALSGNEYAYLNDLDEEITRYLNDRSWTEDVYLNRERIDCTFAIVFTQALTLTSFEAQITVGASRPIYGTPERTTHFLISDTRWGPFNYAQGQGLIYNPNRFDPMVSVLDFYAYLILGYDYDSFSELGGQGYFERARAIAELARSTSAEGWYVIGDERTRGTLVTQLLDPRYDPLRKALFRYHYGILDHFAIQHEEAWEDTMELLTSLNELYNEFNARRYATDLFFSAKHVELADMLTDYPRRAEAYELLVEMDASHQTTYDRMVQ